MLVHLRTLAVAILMSFVSLTNAFAFAPVYTYIDLGGLVSNTQQSLCCDVYLNERGWVAGTTQVPQYSSGPGAVQAFLYDGQMNYLGGLLQNEQLFIEKQYTRNTSSAHDLNNNGDVVGTSLYGWIDIVRGSMFWEYHAFVYLYSTKTMYDLNDVTAGLPAGTVLKQAFKISDSGYILAQGQNPSSGFSTYLLTPVPVQVSQVPEPSNLWLTLAGLLVVAIIVFWRRRR